MRVLAASVAVLALAAGIPMVAPAPASAASPGTVTYQPPVDAPVVDPFRPPSTPYGSGNRGIDYATTPGTPVRAAAPGQVVFAGTVGVSRHVVILHPDGLRTSYSFLRSTAVRRDQRVTAGTVIGTAGAALHFGVRAGDAYLDPMALFGSPPRVHLVPDVLRQPLPVGHERAGLGRSLGSLAGAVLGTPADAIAWARDAAGTGLDVTNRVGQAAAQYLRDQIQQSIDDIFQELRTWVHYMGELSAIGRIGAMVDVASLAWTLSHRLCTPDDEPPPPPAGRRIAVLVAGLGSASDGTGDAGSVSDIDEAALGYAASDVHQFSYRGGTTRQSPYTSRDTLGDLGVAGHRLADLLRELSRDHPGVTIDVIAHSQGGVVARYALTEALSPKRPGAPSIGTLVTLGSPHQGADIASAGFMLGRSKAGDWVFDKASRAAAAGVIPIDPTSTAVRQLAETSEFMRRLNRRPLPRTLRAVSIAADGDLVVPVPRTTLAGATQVVVDLPGISPLADHSRLPGSAEAHREIALAVSGRPPTCSSWLAALQRVGFGEAVGSGTDAFGALGSLALLAGTGRTNPFPDMTHTSTPGAPRPDSEGDR